MKFIDSPAAAAANAHLDGLNVGNNCRLNSRLEVFSCKRVSDEKKLARSLDEKLLVESSSPGLSSSPFGPLQAGTSRKTFINLVSLLNALFPDYDFSSVGVTSFVRQHSQAAVRDAVDSALNAVVPGYFGPAGAGADLWAALAAATEGAEAEIYSYVPGPEDPFTEPGTLWSLNYFWVARKARRVVFLGAGLSASPSAYSPLSSASVCRAPATAHPVASSLPPLLKGSAAPDFFSSSSSSSSLSSSTLLSRSTHKCLGVSAPGDEDEGSSEDDDGADVDVTPRIDAGVTVAARAPYNDAGAGASGWFVGEEAAWSSLGDDPMDDDEGYYY